MVKPLSKYRYWVLFFLLFILCYLIPYSGDDWGWGSLYGMEQLRNHFDGLNGRYSGNLIEIALTRSNLLKAAAIAGALTGIIRCIELLTGTGWSFYLSCFLLAGIPRALAQQGIFWVAGFSNYTTAAFFILVYLAYTRRIWEPELTAADFPQKPLHIIPLFLLALVNATLAEHMTIYNVLLGAFVVLFLFFRVRKVPVQHFSYFLGSVFGLVLMFSNSAYRTIVRNGGDHYRTVPTKSLDSLISTVMENLTGVITYDLFLRNTLLNLLLILVFGLLLVTLRRKTVSGKYLSVLSASLFYFAAFYLVILFFRLNTASAGLSNRAYLVICLGALLAYGCILLFSLIVSLRCFHAPRVIFYLCSILCIAAPLLVVYPVGSRCFLPTYFLHILLLCEFIKLLPLDRWEALHHGAGLLKRGLLVCSLLIFSCYLLVFGTIYRVNTRRISHMQEAIRSGETRVELLRCPYPEFVWFLNPPKEGIQMEKFRQYYEVPPDVTIVPVDAYSQP